MSQFNEKNINLTYIDYDRELADYFGKSIEWVKEERGKHNFDNEWKASKIKNCEDANKFYAETLSNLFRQAIHREKRLVLYRRALKEILSTQNIKELGISYSGNEYKGKSFAKYTKNTVLDYGCGIGDIGLMMAMLGYEVDLMEIGNSEAEKFIKWRFEKRYLPCNFIPYGRPLKRNYYDIVFCIDVLEHHEKPREALQDIFNSMNRGSYLFLSYGWIERTGFYANALGDAEANREFILPFLQTKFITGGKDNFLYIRK